MNPATARPWASPAVTSKRKWLPLQTTLFSASAAAAEKLANEWVSPFTSSDVRLNATVSVPKKSARTAAAAPLIPPCAETHDGWLAVLFSGSQLGSATVSGLPSWSASWTAVTGRHRLYVYLASK